MGAVFALIGALSDFF